MGIEVVSGPHGLQTIYRCDQCGAVLATGRDMDLPPGSVLRCGRCGFEARTPPLPPRPTGPRPGPASWDDEGQAPGPVS